MKFTSRPAAVGSQARIDNSFGVLKLVLHENSYEWQFLSSGFARRAAGRHRARLGQRRPRT